MSSEIKKRIVIIGGGAAGIFAAINAAEHNRFCKVLVLEKSSKLLSKVKVSGGGRCNATHACFDTNLLVKNYPRGEAELKSAFSRFAVKDTINWFEKNNVQLKTEADGRMFPVTDNSQTIIDCLLQKANELGVKIETNANVKHLKQIDDLFSLTLDEKVIEAHSVIIASGGQPTLQSFKWLADLGLQIVAPVPSLFTFNVPVNPFKDLMGVSVGSCLVKIESTKFQNTGALLFTHWGLSGPAVLKLSAYAARLLNEKQYLFNVSLNFLPAITEDNLRQYILNEKQNHPNKRIFNLSFEGISSRLFERLCELSDIQKTDVLANMNKKQLNKLVTNLTHFVLNVHGKTTFKEEFVTSGGVDLKEIDMKTMQCKKIPGLFFAGEIMNVDGVTGGFNFQHAWTSGYLAGINAAG